MTMILKSTQTVLKKFSAVFAWPVEGETANRALFKAWNTALYGLDAPTLIQAADMLLTEIDHFPCPAELLTAVNRLQTMRRLESSLRLGDAQAKAEGGVCENGHDALS
ncbi:MAG: hypothetical protein Q8Q50_02825 [Methylobacter sp.]|nr:hypothetical protein [Methylobacter sp.]